MGGWHRDGDIAEGREAMVKVVMMVAVVVMKSEIAQYYYCVTFRVVVPGRVCPCIVIHNLKTKKLVYVIATIIAKYKRTFMCLIL